jgi:hypothetical protein
MTLCWGKLVSSSVHGMSALLAVFPVLALPLLLGGVTLGQCSRMVLVLVNVMFFSLSAGLLASAWCRPARRAMVLTFLLVLLVQAGMPALGAYAEHRQWLVTAWWASLPSAGFAFVYSADLQYQARSEFYWASVLTTHLLAWFFLGAASVLVRRSWQDRPEGVGDRDGGGGVGSDWRLESGRGNFGNGAWRSILVIGWGLVTGYGRC